MASTQLSSGVVWDIIRRESSLLRKTKNIELSSEKLNVRNVNSFKYSGLAQPSIGVFVASGRSRPQLVRTNKNATTPKSAVTSVGLAGGVKRSAKAIHKATKATYYRPDLKRDACAKYAALCRAVAKKSVELPVKRRTNKN